MKNDSGKDPSLSWRIFSSVLSFTLVLIVAGAAVLTAIFYYTFERDAETKLALLAEDAARFLNENAQDDNVEKIAEQFAGMVRYTLVAPDGTVLYDSAADADAMSNHADRPEVQSAAIDGSGAISRYSDTLRTDTVYAAVRLDDGSIVRISETRESLFSFLGNLVAPLVIALLAAVLLALFLSRSLTDRIMKPLESLDFTNPLDNRVYEEMHPFLERIGQQQRQLKEQNEELALAESMRRDFSSNVSHEMKTPLQVISGYAELMKSGMTAPEDNARFAGLIYEEAQSMRSLIDDVLMLSRLDESAFEHDMTTPIDLAEVARRAAERLQVLAAQREVEVSIEGSSVFIAGSEALAEEMLHNLIENGIRYNVPGGKVRVVVSEELVARALAHADRGVTPQQAVALRRGATDEPPFSQRQVVVSVADTGPGIPEDMRDKVFERFFRIDKSRSKETGGTGLGLAIVKHAVLYHSGTIEVKSELGQGTEFIIRFKAL